jgi:transposase-like protein
MTRKLKNYDSKLKAEVAIEAIKGKKSLVEICATHNLPKTNVRDWENKLISEASSIFVAKHEKEKEVKNLKIEIEQLHKIIGEITVENNFLKKKLQ